MRGRIKKMRRELRINLNFVKLLSFSLMLPLFILVSNNALAMTKEQCSLEYKSNLNQLINQDDGAARELAEKVLGSSFQKLAYANHLFANGSEEQLKEFEDKIDKYIRNNNHSPAMDASKVMEQLTEFSSSFRDAREMKESSRAAVRNATKEKLEALIVFSRSLDDKKFHIADYEKEALNKFNFRSQSKKVDGWNLFVGDVARNFYQRRFHDRDGTRDDVDRNFSAKKVSTYDSDVRSAIKKLKEEIIEMAKDMSQDCHQFLRENASNTGMCSLSSPFDPPTQGLILSTENILSRINSPEATNINRPISVHYAGAQFSVESCKVSPSEGFPGKYKIEMAMDFQYIPGADNQDWSMNLFDGSQGHDHVIRNDGENFEDGSNKTLKRFTDRVTYDGVSFPNDDPHSQLQFHFTNSAGEQIKMLSIDDNYSNRDLNGNGSKYFIDCNPRPKPEPEEPLEPVHPTDPLIIYAFSASSDKNIVTLKLQKDEEQANFESDELKASKVNWTLPEGLTCIDNPEDLHKLICALDKEVTEEIEVKFELVDHQIDTNKASPPEASSIILKPEVPAGPTIKVEITEDIPNVSAKLRAVVTGAPEGSKVKWKYKITNLDNSVEEKEEEQPIDYELTTNLFNKVEYTVTVADQSDNGVMENKVGVRISKDGQNKLEDKEVKLKASVDEKYKDLPGNYKWKCDDKECGQGPKLELERTEEKQTISVTFEVPDKVKTTNSYTVSPLKEEREKSDNDEDECEEEDEDSDPFSSRRSKGCTPKEEAKTFAPKYMPPMQQPLILPPSTPYITPGFN
ncbi:putative exported protein [Halobacteriovorax marinus SJ]|uniref:Exported protein n=2 Tax=Halobacteriovorax marinus TaxID=97084 RepID=E1X2D8_HALMS|nr:putative exported protein [Halobacteriovorax marinus SJ]